jgi:hypothetical protein
VSWDAIRDYTIGYPDCVLCASTRQGRERALRSKLYMFVFPRHLSILDPHLHSFFSIRCTHSLKFCELLHSLQSLPTIDFGRSKFTTTSLHFHDQFAQNRHPSRCFLKLLSSPFLRLSLKPGKRTFSHIVGNLAWRIWTDNY